MSGQKSPRSAKPCAKEMATKKSKATVSDKAIPPLDLEKADGRDPKVLYYDAAQFKTDREVGATTAASPVIRGAVTGRAFAARMFGADLDLTEYAQQLQKQSDAVLGGDLNGVKAMLATQATTLDMIFNQLALKATSSEYLSQRDAHLRLALKAQSQCRSTLETLAEILSPRPVAFVRQQTNISSEGGPQQVNVGTPAPSPAPARERKPKPSNELLEQSNGKWLDTRAAGQAGRGDTGLETVGTVDRPQD